MYGLNKYETFIIENCFAVDEVDGRWPVCYVSWNEWQFPQLNGQTSESYTCSPLYSRPNWLINSGGCLPSLWLCFREEVRALPSTLQDAFFP